MGYAEWLWSKWGSKLRPKYQRIEDWDVPWLRSICSSVWGILDNASKKKIYDFVTFVHKKYGEELAKKLMSNLKEFISKVANK